MWAEASQPSVCHRLLALAYFLLDQRVSLRLTSCFCQFNSPLDQFPGIVNSVVAQMFILGIKEGILIRMAGDKGETGESMSLST